MITAHRSRTTLRLSLAFPLIALIACSEGGETEALAGGDGDGDSVPSGGTTSGDGDAATGGIGDGDLATGGTGTGGSGSDDLSECDAAGLVWKTARKTTYTSYPDPNSVECVEYNGCMWAGWFAGCTNQMPEEWVEANNLAAVFPGFSDLSHHRLCIKSGEKRMIVNVVDTCADSDCDGCCTENQGQNDALIDLESFTNARWGLQDGVIEWADLGANPTPVCN